MSDLEKTPYKIMFTIASSNGINGGGDMIPKDLLPEISMKIISRKIPVSIPGMVTINEAIEDDYDSRKSGFSNRTEKSLIRNILRDPSLVNLCKRESFSRAVLRGEYDISTEESNQEETNNTKLFTKVRFINSATKAEAHRSRYTHKHLNRRPIEVESGQACLNAITKKEANEQHILRLNPNLNKAARSGNEAAAETDEAGSWVHSQSPTRARTAPRAPSYSLVAQRELNDNTREYMRQIMAEDRAYVWLYHITSRPPPLPLFNHMAVIQPTSYLSRIYHAHFLLSRVSVMN